MPDDLQAARQDLSALRIRRDPDAPSRGGWGRFLLLLVLAGAAGWLAWERWGKNLRLPVVQTARVVRVAASEASAVLSASGYLLPERRANVSSKAFGRLEWLGIDVGTRVKKDEVLARLANADLSAQLEEARVGVADAERELARWKLAVEKGAEARERLDHADTALALARARQKSAEAALEYSLIRAPFDGIVVRKGAELGETVGPASGSATGSAGGYICTVVAPDSLEMVADVNETNIARVRVGQDVELAADALPERKIRGQVRQIVPTADRQKGIVQVKIRLLDRDEALLPEMSARATFLREGAKAASPEKRVLAPRVAVREKGGRSFVLVVEADRVRAVPVETGDAGEQGVEIRSGLSGGELVVLGGETLEDGVHVRLADAK
ncbi:MAG: efflux RND transporter periplasmic adaptor subunit [Planctomycetes bacterium]|nr:efflux RND transporter periplasmic adaptor subunit [Planctomycetota bacterium]